MVAEILTAPQPTITLTKTALINGQPFAVVPGIGIIPEMLYL